MKVLQDHQKTALIYNDVKYSYSDLLKQASVYKELMQDIAPKKVMIFAENRPEWIFSFYGGWMNQATIVPVDMMSSADELSYMINDCQPEVIFTSSERKSTLEEALAPLDINTNTFIFDELPDQTAKEPLQEVIFEDIQQTAVIIYTSGTTGNPKGVMLSYENIHANIIAVTEDINIYTKEDRVMILLPLHHIFPLLGTMAVTFFTGCTAAMAPTLTSVAIIKTLQENKINIMIGVPRLYEMIRKGIMDKIKASKMAYRLFKIARAIDSQKVSRILFKTVHKKFGGELNSMVCGGAPLDVAVAKDFKALGFEMLEGFGMTEAAPMISFTRPGKWKIGAAGTAMSCTKIEIRDGEVVASGKNIMQGYYNRPEETAEVLKDGWLYTGDLGKLDKKGYLTITGRKKEIIVLSNGKNINPSPIEAQLTEIIDEIEEVGVILHEDKLHAIIKTDDALLQKKNITDLANFFRKQLNENYNNRVAPYKKITRFTLVDDALPRTRLEKLQRFKLQEMLNPAIKKTKAGVQEEFKEYTIIKTFLEEQKSTEISPTDHLEFDLALDSLDKVSFQSFLESSFGVDIKVEKFTNFPSIMKLAEHIRETKKKIKFERPNWSEILKERVSISLPKSSLFGQVSLKISKYFFKTYFRLRTEGVKNIPDGPCIFAPNHQSYLDGFMVASLLKRKTFKRTFFYAKEKHVRKRWLKAFARRNNIIIMDMNNDLKLSIQKMASSLRMNKNIIIFPEGTRSKDGSLGSFKETFAILSRELSVPIVPIAINGAYDALPSGSKFPRPFKKIRVDFLEAVQPQDHSYESLKLAVQERIQTHIG